MKKEKDSYDYLANSACSPECTGLMPTPADTEEKRESYDDLHHILPSVTDVKDHKK